MGRLSETLLLAFAVIGCGPTASSMPGNTPEVRLIAFDLSGAYVEATSLRNDADPVWSNDQAAILALVDCINTAHEAENHRIGGRLLLRIIPKSGEYISLEVLAVGADYCEFRSQGRIYHVPRTPFMDALAKLGVHGSRFGL